MEEAILLLLVWTLLLIILFLLFLYTFSSSLQELWGALFTGTFGKQSQKPQVFINQQLQGYPQRTRLQKRLYGFCEVPFLAFRVPCRPKLSYFCA